MATGGDARTGGANSSGGDSPTGGSAKTGGDSTTGGVATTGGVSDSGTGGAQCPPECFVPVQCVAKCGDMPQNNGCCPCSAGTINATSCGTQEQGVSCDARDVTCGDAAPTCEDGMAASVKGDCWGPCVPIDWCLCSAPEFCPDANMYTCHMSAGRCGPYVN